MRLWPVFVLAILVTWALCMAVVAWQPACGAGYCPATPCMDSNVCWPDCVCIRSGAGSGTCSSISHAG